MYHQNVTDIIEDDKITLQELDIDTIGDEHLYTSIETPLREDAFALSDDMKIEKIEHHFRAIMETLGLDLTDDSLKGTPYRVAKMYVKEIFEGLNPANKPKIALFANKYGFHDMLVEKNINFYSNCEHHFVPIFGKVHVAYIPEKKVIGLSKINRVVQHFAKRPQVQERLTIQIGRELSKILETENIAVIVDAKHLCVSSRGIKDESSFTSTLQYGGVFNQREFRGDFYKLIQKD